jgi:3-oxoadipate enol-lactonase
LDELNIDRAHLVGVSMGGMVGLGFGILHPDRIQSLTLCATRGDAPAAFAAGWDERIVLATKEGTGVLVHPPVSVGLALTTSVILLTD